MEEKTKQIIEAILFAAGRSVSVREISMVLEKSPEEVTEFIENLKNEYKNSDRGMEIIKLNDSYQMCTKKVSMNIYHQYLIKKQNQICQMRH